VTGRDAQVGVSTRSSGPSQPAGSGTGLAAEVRRAGDALLELGSARGEDVAGLLAQLITAIAEEAARSARLSKAIRAAIDVPTDAAPGQAKRSNRRAPGVLDPFGVFTEVGEQGLRARLSELSLEQLRDIVAEHGMDNDRLAMRWRTPARVIDRIADRVAGRLAKGSAFRGQSAFAGSRPADRSSTPAEDA
jgi:hypothetical protein